MKEIIETLDENLVYHEHQVYADHIDIFVHSRRESVSCHFCGQISSKIHSRYQRCFQDLPIQGKKVYVYLLNRKYFCSNPECTHATFAESFNCLKPKSKKSERLIDEILKVSGEVSSVTASKLLSDSVVDIGKSTIYNLLKKRQTE